MARKSDSFERSKPRFKPQPSVLVICEDIKSSKTYLEEAINYFRIDVKVEISHCGRTDPKGIIESAISQLKKYDQVYCVIDRDSHETFEEALMLVKQTDKVKVVASYPCFEFWLLLHFKYTTKCYNASGKLSAGDCLVGDLRTCEGMAKYAKGDTKGLFAYLLGDRLKTARKNSLLILTAAVSDGEMNPSTKMHELIDVFENLTEPQLVK